MRLWCCEPGKSNGIGEDLDLGGFALLRERTETGFRVERCNFVRTVLRGRNCG